MISYCVAKRKTFQVEINTDIFLFIGNPFIKACKRSERNIDFLWIGISFHRLDMIVLASQIYVVFICAVFQFLINHDYSQCNSVKKYNTKYYQLNS